MSTDYRERMYGAYVRSSPLANSSQALPDANTARPMQERVVKVAFPANREARIIDLGCGAGALLEAAEHAGYRHLEGVDGSPEQVEAAHAQGREFVRKGDLRDTLRETADGTYDAVVAFDVIEHFTKDELLPFVDEVRRVLKPGGRWILHVPNAQSPLGMRVRYGDFTHELAFTPSSLSQLLTASGFASVQCYEDEPVVHGVKSAGRWVVWQGIRSMLRLWYAAETGEYERNVFSQSMLAVALR